MENSEMRLMKCDEDRQVIPVAAGAEMIGMLCGRYSCSCTAGKRSFDSSRVTITAMMEYLPPIGQNIRRLRLARGMTQRQLAFELRVSMQAVSKWERGQAYPDLTLLVPIARLFSVTLDELFGCE